MNPVIVLIILFLTSICTASNYKKNKLHIEYKGTPSFYSNSIYTLNKNQNIVKLSFGGTEIWQADPAIDTKQFQLHFNKLYVLSHSGKLSCFDGIYGFKEWENTDNKVKDFQVFNTFIVMNDIDGHLSCIGTKSGQTLWTQKETSINEFTRVGRSELIVGLSNNQLSILDIVSGKIVDKKKLPKKKMTILGVSNSSLFLNKKKDIYEFNLNKRSFSKIQENTLKNAKKILGSYYYTQDKHKIQFYKFNVEDPLWTINSEKTIQNVIFYPEYFVVQSSESEFQIYDSLTAHRMTDIFDIDIEDINKSYFYPSDDNIIILDDTSIYTVKRVKL